MTRLLIGLLIFAAPLISSAFASVPMPPVLVLVLCKVVQAGPPDQNVEFTHSENLAWATENSMMICKRQEVQLYDPAVDAGASPRPFTSDACRQAGPMVATAWNERNHGSGYRVWRVACPTPMIDLRTGEVVGWVIPDCGHRETVRCEVDSVI